MVIGTGCWPLVCPAEVAGGHEEEQGEGRLKSWIRVDAEALLEQQQQVRRRRYVSVPIRSGPEMLVKSTSFYFSFFFRFLWPASRLKQGVCLTMSKPGGYGYGPLHNLHNVCTSPPLLLYTLRRSTRKKPKPLAATAAARRPRISSTCRLSVVLLDQPPERLLLLRLAQRKRGGAAVLLGDLVLRDVFLQIGKRPADGELVAHRGGHHRGEDLEDGGEEAVFWDWLVGFVGGDRRRGLGGSW